MKKLFSSAWKVFVSFVRKVPVLKTAILLPSVLTTMLCYCAAAYAALGTVEPQPDSGGTSIISTASQIATNITNIAQSLFGIAAVIFIIWAGIMFFGAQGDPKKITTAKQAFAGFVVAMVCVFFADKIVAAVLGMMGITNVTY